MRKAQVRHTDDLFLGATLFGLKVLRRRSQGTHAQHALAVHRHRDVVQNHALELELIQYLKKRQQKILFTGSFVRAHLSVEILREVKVKPKY